MSCSRWIKMRMDLDEDPKVIAMAQRLRISVDTVIGKLFRLWRWAAKHASDGNVTQPLTTTWLDSYTAQAGFAESLILVGWLDATGPSLVFVNFTEHNWEIDRSQELAAERQRRYRERKRVTRNAGQRDRNVVASRTPIPIPTRGMDSPSTPSCSEAERPPREPVESAVLTYPTTGEVKEWHLTQKYIDEWKTAFPALDIEGECRRALAWVNANPGKRKTARGMPRFLVAWLERSQNSGAGGRAGGGGSHARPGDAVGPGGRVRPPEGKYDNLDDSWLFAPGAPGEAARPLAPRGDAECPPD